MSEIALQIDPGKTLRPNHGQTKLTRKKKKIVLQELASKWNMTAAAAKIGVTRECIVYNIKRDETFATAIQTVKDAYLDNTEETSFIVASEQSRDGFNDRKLLLQAHRPVYNPKSELNINQHVSIEFSVPELTRILQQSSSRSRSSKPQEIDEAPEAIEYREI